MNGYFDPQANPWAETYSGVVPLVCSARVTSVLVQAVGRSGTLTQGEYQGAGLTLPDMLPYTDTGGGGSKIMYSIDSTTTHGSASPYNGLVVATVTVIVAPCDRSELIDTQVEVVDHSGCLFDEPANDLVGRIGWAFEGIAKSRASGAAPGELTPCHWAADGLCCPTGV